MVEEDQKKTAFTTSQGLYCYKGKEEWMDDMFSKQTRRNMEVCVDDMFVKSKEEFAHLDHLQETFTTLKQYQMKLNSSECTFRVASRKFLGFMVSERGIEANLEKVRAILDMTLPKTVKEG